MPRQLPIIDDESKELYRFLSDELLLVSLRWQIALERFGHDQERATFLNRAELTFDQICQTTFRDDTYITLSRLTAPLRSFGHDNLCLYRLLDPLDKTEHAQFATHLACLILRAEKLCEPFTDYRNRRLAHLDLSTITSSQPRALPKISVEQTTHALKSVQDVVNAFASYFFDTTIYFGHVFR